MVDHCKLRIRPQGPFKFRRLDHSAGTGDNGYLHAAAPFQFPEGTDGAVMLHGRGHGVPPRVEHPLYGQVQCVSSVGAEDDTHRVSDPEEGTHGLAGRKHDLPGVDGQLVSRPSRVAADLRHILHNGIHHRLRLGEGCCGIVEINEFFGFPALRFHDDAHSPFIQINISL